MSMYRSSVLWFFAVIISTQTCVTSLGFPMLNLNNIFNYSISDALKDVSQLPNTALNMLHPANPLNYMTHSALPENSGAGQYTSPQNYPIKPSHPEQFVPPGSSFPNDEVKESFHSMEYYPGSNPATFSKLPTGTTQQHYLREITTPIRTNYKYYDITKKSTRSTIIDMSETREIPESSNAQNIGSPFDHFMQVLAQMERKFYQATFYKLLSRSSPGRIENGISFAQSGLFLYIQLMALCVESDSETASEIKQSLGLKTTCAEQVHLLKHLIQTLPISSDFLKLRWSSRLVLGPLLSVSGESIGNTTSALYIHLDHLNNTDPLELAKRLNYLVEIDSGGAMQNTFEEDELSTGVCAVWLTTLYMRARWRSAPTVLNGTRSFYDGGAAPRTVSMIRINDFMRYARLVEWDAEAIEIQYAYPDLTFLILLPRERSLRNLARRISTENLQRIYENMNTKRLAVTLPIYTLRMTLLLPGKLEMMGMSRLLSANAGCDSLKLSHAVQRIMFWAEAGRNAFKDDGIEWDEPPELERIVDRPYIYFVRWRNLTLLNGNFVL